MYTQCTHADISCTFSCPFARPRRFVFTSTASPLFVCVSVSWINLTHMRTRTRLRERFLDFITSHLEKLSGITCRSPPLDFATGATPHPLPIAVDIKHVASSALLALEGSLPNIRWGLGGAPSDGDETNALVPPPRSASRRRDWIVELKALGGEYIFDVERNAPQGGDADHDVPPPTPPIADARASVSASMTSSPLLAASTPSASSLASTDTDDEVVNDGVLPLQSRARGDASIDGNAVDVGAGDAHVMLGNINNRLDSLLSQIETVRLEHGGEAIVAGSAAAVDGDTDHEVESLSADVVLPSMSAAPPPPSGAQLRPIGGGVGGGGDHHEHDLSIDIIANSELSSGSSSYLRAMQGSLDYWRLEASSLRRTKTDMENEIGLMRQLLDLQKMELSQMANRYNEQSLRLRQMMGDISAMDTMSYQELSQLEFCLGESIAAVRSRKDEIWERMEKNMSKVTRSCAVCMENFPDTVLMPCGHSCLCHECCHQLLNTGDGDSGGNSLLDDAGGSGRELKCPICRTAIVSTIRIFV